MHARTSRLAVWPTSRQAARRHRAVPLLVLVMVLVLTTELGPSPVDAARIFRALTDSGWFPPDSALAVGRTRLIAAANGAVALLQRDGSPISRVSLATFLTPTGHDPGRPFDPRALYDGDRFFVLATKDFASDSLPGGVIAIATSKSSTPSVLQPPQRNTSPHGWHVVDVVVSEKRDYWADYPCMGADSANIYVSINFFATNGGITRSGLLVVPKASLLAGHSDGNRIMPIALPSGVSVFSAQPALHLDASSPHAIMLSLSGTSSMVVHRWPRNSLFSGAESLIRPVPSFAGSVPDGPQADASAKPLDMGDSRLQATSIVAGFMWTAHTVRTASGTSAIRWYEFDVRSSAGPVLRQSGTLMQTGTWLGYPAIAGDASHNVVLTLTMVSPQMHASMAFAYRTAAMPASSMLGPYVVAPGTAAYSRVHGTRNRWGDYSSIALDPLDQHTFWMQGMVAAGSRLWATYVMEICIDPVACAPSGCTSGCVNGSCRFGHCFCLPGWHGARCDTPLEHCLLPCVHGECRVPPSGPATCLCQEQWSGQLCDVPVSAAAVCVQQCQPHGVCSDPGVCLCDDGWAGQDCTLPVCPSSCAPHGVCNDVSGSCDCVDGWTGTTCDDPVCTDCQHGFCLLPGLCSCDDHWTGSACDIPLCSSTCGHGSCTAPDVCTCNTGWTGDRCDTPLCTASGCPAGVACIAPDVCADQDVVPECPEQCPGNQRCSFPALDCECMPMFRGNDCDIGPPTLPVRKHGPVAAASAAIAPGAELWFLVRLDAASAATHAIRIEMNVLGAPSSWPLLADTGDGGTSADSSLAGLAGLTLSVYRDAPTGTELQAHAPATAVPMIAVEVFAGAAGVPGTGAQSGADGGTSAPDTLMYVRVAAEDDAEPTTFEVEASAEPRAPSAPADEPDNGLDPLGMLLSLPLQILAAGAGVVVLVAVVLAVAVARRRSAALRSASVASRPYLISASRSDSESGDDLSDDDGRVARRSSLTSRSTGGSSDVERASSAGDAAAADTSLSAWLLQRLSSWWLITLLAQCAGDGADDTSRATQHTSKRAGRPGPRRRATGRGSGTDAAAVRRTGVRRSGAAVRNTGVGRRPAAAKAKHGASGRGEKHGKSSAADGRGRRKKK